LSLWEAMGAPLRCLDEYDVFMDDVNRDVTTKMIVSCPLARIVFLYSFYTDQRRSSLCWSTVHLDHSKGTWEWRC
jgi:hypothetical protein